MERSLEGLMCLCFQCACQRVKGWQKLDGMPVKGCSGPVGFASQPQVAHQHRLLICFGGPGRRDVRCSRYSLAQIATLCLSHRGGQIEGPKFGYVVKMPTVWPTPSVSSSTLAGRSSNFNTEQLVRPRWAGRLPSGPVGGGAQRGPSSFGSGPWEPLCLRGQFKQMPTARQCGHSMKCV